MEKVHALVQEAQETDHVGPIHEYRLVIAFFPTDEPFPTR